MRTVAGFDGPPIASSSRTAPAGANALSSAERALIGVARWPDPQFNAEGSQEAYGNRFADAVDNAADLLKSGKLKDVNDLWNFATDWRVAQLPGGNVFDQMEFRHRRTKGDPPSMTPIEGRYAFFAERIKESDLMQVKPTFLGRPDVQMVELLARDTINAAELRLTHLTLPYKKGSDFTELVNLSEFARPLMHHTAPFQVETIMAEVNRLGGELKNVPPESQMQALGEMHWWLAHAMPDRRGSAAKAELSIRALGTSLGYAMPPFKAGCIPDLEAFVTPLQDFKKNYASLFDRPPEKAAATS